jgi:hypothetical protein
VSALLAEYSAASFAVLYFCLYPCLYPCPYLSDPLTVSSPSAAVAGSVSLPPALVDEELVSLPLAVFVSVQSRASAEVFC